MRATTRGRNSASDPEGKRIRLPLGTEEDSPEEDSPEEDSPEEDSPVNNCSPLSPRTFDSLVRMLSHSENITVDMHCSASTSSVTAEFSEECSFCFENSATTER